MTGSKKPEVLVTPPVKFWINQQIQSLRTVYCLTKSNESYGI